MSKHFSSSGSSGGALKPELCPLIVAHYSLPVLKLGHLSTCMTMTVHLKVFEVYQKESF